MTTLPRALSLSLMLCLSASAAQSRSDVDGARVALAAGRFEEVEARLIDELDQGGDEARMLVAEARVALGRGLSALEVLDPLLEREQADVQLLAGRAFLFAGDELADQGANGQDVGYYYEVALDTLTRAAELAPRGDVEAALEAGWLALYDFGDHERAAKLAHIGLSKAPENAELALLEGCSLTNAWAAARPADDPAAATDGGAKTEEPIELTQLWTRAHDALSRADELLEESRGEAALQLSWLHEARGEAARAVELAVRHVDQAGADETGLLYRLARRYADERDWSASWAALDALLARAPESLLPALRAEDDPSAAAVALGWSTSALVNKGRRAEARDVLARLLELEPTIASIWNDHAFLCRETARYEDSYASYERAVALDPSNPRLLNDTALILQYHLHRDLDRARELYGRAIELAEAALEADEPGADRGELRSALTDARNNLSRLGRSSSGRSKQAR